MSELIDIISKKGKLLDFMDRYHLIGLREATEEQLKEYIEEDAKRLSVLHDMAESIYGGQTHLNADELVQRVKKDLHNV